MKVYNFFKNLVKRWGEKLLQFNQTFTASMNDNRWLIGGNLTPKVTIKVYLTGLDREQDLSMLDSLTVSTVQDFNAFLAKYSFPQRYFAFESNSGAQLKSAEAARFFLEEPLVDW